MKIARHSAHSEFEKSFGFVRALRTSNSIYVAGCTAMEAGGALGDVKVQTHESLTRAANSIKELADSYVVVRTRFFVTAIDDWRDVGEIHREFFGPHLPVSTLVEVSALAHPSLKVEVEVDAVALDD